MSKSNIKIKFLLIGAIFLGLVVFDSKHIFADTDCSLLQGDAKDQCNSLNDKIDAYTKIIDLKNQQEQSLNNQIDILNAQTGKIQSQISLDQNQIQDMNDQITDLENGINEQQASLDEQKTMLSDLIQEYAITKQEDPVDMLASNDNFSDFFGKNDQLAQIESKVKDLYDNIKAIKTNLETEKSSLEDKKQAVVSDYTDLQQKNSDLQDTVGDKQTLLSQTQGDESKYQDLLNRVEQEKEELLNIDQLGVGLSASNYPTPPFQYFASKSVNGKDWYYSQKDSRWADESIGNSKSSIGSYGCAVTSVAMVFDYFGSSITPGQLADKSIFSWDLISWPASWSSPSLSLVSGDSHGNVSWSTIDSELKKSNPVIVYIQKTKGSGGHYVVIHHKTSDGKYVVNDPYWGENIYLDTSRALVGLLAPQSGTVVNQMIVYDKN